MATKKLDITERLSMRIQNHIDKGTTLSDACVETISWIQRQNLASETLTALGPEVLAYFWRNKQHHQRRFIICGERRVDLDALNSPQARLMEQYWEVSGKWKPLGHMVQAECSQLADKYERFAQGNARMARGFTCLVNKLPNAKTTVEKVFSEEEIAACFEIPAKQATHVRRPRSE